MFLDELVSPSVLSWVSRGADVSSVVVVSGGGGGGNLLIRLLLDGRMERGRGEDRRGCFSVVVAELERGDHLMFLLLSSFLPPPRPDPESMTPLMVSPAARAPVARCVRPVACYLVELQR